MLDGPGEFEVEVTNACGTVSDAVSVDSAGPSPTVNLGPDQGYCAADFPIMLDAGAADSYLWSTGETTQNIELADGATVSVEITTACGTATDEIMISNSGNTPNLDLGAGMLVCDADFPITLDAGVFDSYAWNTGEDTQLIVVNGPGEFEVTVTNSCGTVSDEISVSSAGDVPTVDLGPDQSVCDADFPIILDAGPADVYLWSTGETTQSISVAGPAVITVEVNNTCGSASDEITIESQGDSPALDLGADQILCPSEMPLVLESNIEGDYLWSTGQTTSAIVINSPGTYSLTVINGCGTATDDLVLTVLENEIIAEDFAFCAGDSLIFEGQVFYNDGDYEIPIPNGASTGCDLIYQLGVSTISNPVLEESYVLPFDQSLEIYGETLNENGVSSFLTEGENGCDQEVEVTLLLEERPPILIHVPNAFTPDGDGFNEVFKPEFYDLEASPLSFYEFRIYNRWGDLMHMSNDPLGNGWIGRAVGGGTHYTPDDVYNWVILYQEEFSTDRKEMRGMVTILR